MMKTVVFRARKLSAFISFSSYNNKTVNNSYGFNFVYF